jgi:hydroxyacylglutathione hydrolase
MFVQQLYTGCISEAAYYIESEGEAAVIDPLRDIDEYLKIASDRKAKIKFIFETHFHADFVSGHLDLAAATGATIIYGPNTVCNFPVTIAKDGDIFNIGKLSIKVLHTPGHTLESCCYLLINEEGKDHAVFSGDTLFVGDVGRPDLAQNGSDIETDDLAELLFESLQQKIIPLADDVILYPGHGAGSNCGKNLGTETFSTIGKQKKDNYALQSQSKEEFIKAITEGLDTPPAYFSINAKINKEGYESLEALIKKGLHPLSVGDLKTKKKDEDVIILDTRSSDEFVQGYVPDSIFIGLEGRFGEWAGSLLPFDREIILITEKGKEKESIVRLARVGFNKIAGYLEGGYQAWKDSGERFDLIINAEADELAMDIPFDDHLVIIDVRKETEYGDEHIKDAINIPLIDLLDPGSMANFEDHHNIYLHCAGGYRSVIAASLIKRQGIHNIHNIPGGWNKIKELKDQFVFEKSAEVLN